MNDFIKKYYILLSFALLVLAIIIFVFFQVSTKKTPTAGIPGQGTVASTSIKTADLLIGQYNERPNARLPREVEQLAAVGALEPLVRGCALRFSFIPKTKVVNAGESIFYTATLKNAGKSTCVNVSFSVYYSGDETFVGSTPPPTASTYYWKVGTLRSRGTFTVDIQTKAGLSAGLSEIQNQSCATGNNTGGDVCVDSIILVQQTALPSDPLPPAPLPPPIGSIEIPPQKEFGVWIWDSPIQMTGDHRRTIIESAAQHHFNAVYVTIDDYLDIATLPEGSTKEIKKEAYFSALASLIALAQSKGIALDVEGGARDWAQPQNRWKGYALIDAVNAYNSSHPQAKIRGLQYDVEPYLLPNYETDKATVLREYVEFIDGAVTRAQGMDAQFSIVIPHFYDSTQAWTPAINYNGKIAHTYTHLLDLLEKKPKSTVLVMAYRNFFEGNNGTREISNAEIIEASASTYSTRVIVAQETGNVSPAYVTFYGFSQADFLTNVSTIYSAFQNTQGFGGVAVHYIDPFLALK